MRRRLRGGGVWRAFKKPDTIWRAARSAAIRSDASTPPAPRQEANQPAGRPPAPASSCTPQPLCWSNSGAYARNQERRPSPPSQAALRPSFSEIGKITVDIARRALHMGGRSPLSLRHAFECPSDTRLDQARFFRRASCPWPQTSAETSPSQLLQTAPLALTF
jgi:hypothetical protein